MKILLVCVVGFISLHPFPLVPVERVEVPQPVVFEIKPRYDYDYRYYRRTFYSKYLDPEPDVRKILQPPIPPTRRGHSILHAPLSTGCRWR